MFSIGFQCVFSPLLQKELADHMLVSCLIQDIRLFSFFTEATGTIRRSHTDPFLHVVAGYEIGYVFRIRCSTIRRVSLDVD